MADDQATTALPDAGVEKAIATELLVDLGSVIQKGPHWHGFSALTQCFIFAASHSDVGWRKKRSPLPTRERPLGVEWPGHPPPEFGITDTNWVSWLVKNELDATQEMLVYDFAMSGANVDRALGDELDDFKSLVADDGISPVGDSSLTALLIGGNDMAFNWPIEHRTSRLAELFEAVYQAGGRNFLVMYIGPRVRPQLEPGQRPSKAYTTIHERTARWNVGLHAVSSSFAASHPDTTFLIFDTYAFLDRLLSTPTSFGFAAEDPGEPWSGIWADQVHLTSKVHVLLARGLARFLRSVPAHG